MGLLKNSRRIAIQDMQSMVNHGQSEKIKGRSAFIRFEKEIGEECFK